MSTTVQAPNMDSAMRGSFMVRVGRGGGSDLPVGLPRRVGALWDLAGRRARLAPS